MLQIKKQHSLIKGVTAGAVAFAIGLTGTAAFIGDDFQQDSTIYNRERQQDDASDTDSQSTSTSRQTEDKTKDTTPPPSGSETQAATGGATMTQPAAGTISGSTWTPSSSGSSTLSPTGSTTPIGGSGGGSGSGSGSGGTTSSEGDCFCEDLQDATGDILNQETDPLTDPLIEGTQTQLP